MAKIIVYTTAQCPYCVRAKSLFEKKGLPHKEIRVDQDLEQRDIMMEKSGRRSVPQIFINDQHVGGFDDLYLLDQSGELDRMLS